MAAKKFAVSMEHKLLSRLDHLVKSRAFRSRSREYGGIWGNMGGNMGTDY